MPCTDKMYFWLKVTKVKVKSSQKKCMQLYKRSRKSVGNWKAAHRVSTEPGPGDLIHMALIFQ